MAALSDYLESGLLNHVFRGSSFPKPTNISIALTSGVPHDSHTGTGLLYGGLLPELSSGIDYNGNPTLGATSSGTNYSRVNLGDPIEGLIGNDLWSHVTNDIEAGSGVIRNSGQIVFNTALTDWGWVSGIAILDGSDLGGGKLLMHSQLDNPRLIYTGDNVKFDVATLEISFK